MTEVTAAKLEALGQGLERSGSVTFRNGAVVKRGKGGGITVERRYGRTVIAYTVAGRDLERAYDLALHGDRQRREPQPKPQPQRRARWMENCDPDEVPF